MGRRTSLPGSGGKGAYIYRGRAGRGRERAQGTQRSKLDKKKRGEVKVGGGRIFFSPCILTTAPHLHLLITHLKDEKEADVCSGLLTRAKRSPSCSPDTIPNGRLWKALWDCTASGCPGIMATSLHPPRVHWFTCEWGAVGSASPRCSIKWGMSLLSVTRIKLRYK